MLLIVACGVLHGLRIGRSGAAITPEDPRLYLQSAHQLVLGHGLAIFPTTQTFDEGVQRLRTGFFPPLTALAYALPIWLGLRPELSPTLWAIALWPLFLALLALLAVRLSGSWSHANLIVALAAICWPLVTPYGRTGGEVFFLPLLVAVACLLVAPPPPRAVGRLLLVSALLAALTMTRYVAVVFLPAVVAWWTLWRLRQRKARALLVELAILLASALPLALWLLAMRDAQGSLTSASYGWRDSYTLVRRLTSLAKHVSWIGLPSLRPLALWRSLGAAGLLLLVPPLAAAAVLARDTWRARPWSLRELRPPRTPIPFLLATYLGIFLVLKTFGMNDRYAAVALCLLLPWLPAAAFRTAPRRAALATGAILACNLIALTLVVAANPVPGWLSIHPPFLGDVAGRYAEAEAARLRGVPPWLLHPPARLGDLERHHPDLRQLLRAGGDETPIITNANELMPQRPTTRLGAWLATGSCEGAVPRLVVVVDWDRWAAGREGWGPGPALPAQYLEAVRAKCPAAEAMPLRHGIAFRLPPRLEPGGATGSG